MRTRMRSLLVLALATGCATTTRQEYYARYPWGDAFLTCRAAMKHDPDYAVATSASLAVTLLTLPTMISADGWHRRYLTRCMGDQGWARGGDPWRQMTPAERENWPTAKAEIIEYEKSRADSIRKP